MEGVQQEIKKKPSSNRDLLINKGFHRKHSQYPKVYCPWLVFLLLITGENRHSLYVYSQHASIPITEIVQNILINL